MLGTRTSRSYPRAWHLLAVVSHSRRRRRALAAIVGVALAVAGVASPASAAVLLHFKATRGHQQISARGVVLSQRGRAVPGVAPKLEAKFPSLRCEGAGTSTTDLFDGGAKLDFILQHPGATGDCGANDALFVATFDGRGQTAATTYGRVTVGQRWSTMPRALRRHLKVFALKMGFVFYGIPRVNACHPARNLPMNLTRGAAFFVARELGARPARVTEVGVNGGALSPKCA